MQTYRPQVRKPLVKGEDTGIDTTITPPPVDDTLKRLEAAQEAAQAQGSPCRAAHCSCPPCLRGDCDKCWVDSGKASATLYR